MATPIKANIVEVGPRDGFQMEKAFIPTETKVAVINALARTGLTKIETTSFVHPRVVPQMKDAREVMQKIERVPGVTYTALVPNTRGAERALEAGVDGINFVVCASETYNQRNAGMSIEEGVNNCREIVALGKAASVPVEAVIGVAFGCPLEGEVPEDSVFQLAANLANLEVDGLSLADSLGLGNPAQFRRMTRRAKTEFPEMKLSLHIHNTRGLGLANVLAALEEGIDTFDAALGGLGGCPVVPNATGNIATEDLAYMLGEMGIETGVDIEAVRGASRIVQDFLGRPLPSYILSAGTREQLFRHIEQPKGVSVG